MKIEAVVFDWGGVLAGNVADRAAEVEQRYGLAPGSLPALLGLDPYDTDLTNMWHRRELGRATALEWAQWYSARLAAAGGPTIPPEMLVASERDRFSLPPNQPILDALPRLKKAGYRLAICTNNFLETGEFWRAGLPLDLFDAVVVSCDLGLRKPDPEMYDHVSGALQLRAAAIVLVDDLPANIAGARRAGWHTVLVGADPQQAIEELDRLLAHN
jgi:putative hydrolase of the HAD superfamily